MPTEVGKKPVEEKESVDSRPSYLDSFKRVDAKPVKFRTVYPKKRFKYDEKGNVIVVDDGVFDVKAETQSHAREVGFENIVHRLPDGQLVVTSGTTSGVPMYLDTTRISTEPNQARKDLEAMQSEKKSLDSTYGEHDWNSISGDELQKVIEDYVASKTAKKEDKNDAD